MVREVISINVPVFTIYREENENEKIFCNSDWQMTLLYHLYKYASFHHL